jgi:adenylate cyclase
MNAETPPHIVSEPPSASEAVPASAVRPTVLVVDDTPDNLLLLTSILHKHYVVRAANSGQRALDILSANPLPDLVMLDVMMPGMDGHEVIRRMREDPRLRDVPVIFVTALGAPADEERGLALGAVDYIAKPVSPPIVLARVRTHLALADRTATLKSLSDKLSHYLAPQVCDAILSGAHDAVITTRRKRLTIFFSDIQGFTESAESLQPEELTRVLNLYFSEMAAIADQYGATLNKFIGDGILIFFGDPKTRGMHEDALQCVRMAVAMQRRMRQLQAQWMDEGLGRPFRVRMGIHTGYCNVGNFGSRQRMDYTIIGAAVNLASRLEQVADPDGMMLSYETYALVRGEFSAQERPPVKVKGIAREISCFALTGIHERAPSPSGVLTVDKPALQVKVNLDQMSSEQRQSAASELQAMADLLRRAG